MQPITRGLAPLFVAVVSAFVVVSAAQSGPQSEVTAPDARADVAPQDAVAARTQAAARAMRERRFDAAVTELRAVTELAPQLPAGWYELGQAYNAIKQEAMRSFDDRADGAPWRQLLLADSLLAAGSLTEAFTLYRLVLAQLPVMVSIHDSVAQIYERTGHGAWAAQERAKGSLPAAGCAARPALCEFRAGRYGRALSASTGQTDAESRYWTARAASELALAAFAHLEKLPDSRERRAVRATRARAEQRHTDAIAELQAALTLAPGDPALVYELASSCYLARDFDRAVATLSPLLQQHPDDVRLLKLAGYSLLQLRRLEEAVPLLRRAVERDAGDPGPRLALGRAYVQAGDFAAAIPLIEPLVGGDQDGSLHVQLARAYAAVGRRDEATKLLERSQELHRAAEEQAAGAAKRAISPPR